MPLPPTSILHRIPPVVFVRQGLFRRWLGLHPVVVHSLPDKYLFGSGAGLLLRMFSRNIVVVSTYLLTSSQTYCSLCAAGTYSSMETGATACTACPVGQVSDQGQVYCSGCSAGTYLSTNSQTYCSLCAAGTYSTATGSSSCTACPTGTSSDEGL